ncbi:unnamed protein product [Prunus armeniaca]
MGNIFARVRQIKRSIAMDGRLITFPRRAISCSRLGPVDRFLAESNFMPQTLGRSIGKGGAIDRQRHDDLSLLYRGEFLSFPSFFNSALHFLSSPEV